ncbi:hypothetical protein V8F06_006464 [Rhypophila decipiens]
MLDAANQANRLSKDLRSQLRLTQFYIRLFGVYRRSTFLSLSYESLLLHAFTNVSPLHETSAKRISQETKSKIQKQLSRPKSQENNPNTEKHAREGIPKQDAMKKLKIPRITRNKPTMTKTRTTSSPPYSRPRRRTNAPNKPSFLLAETERKTDQIKPPDTGGCPKQSTVPSTGAYEGSKRNETKPTRIPERSADSNSIHACPRRGKPKPVRLLRQTKRTRHKSRHERKEKGKKK